MKRRTHDEYETRQVAPAPLGWRAAYALGPDDASGEPYCFDPVVAYGEVWRKTWICDERRAHVDVERHWHHYGWEALVLDCETATIDRAAEVSNFVGLVGPDEAPTNLERLRDARAAYLKASPAPTVRA